MIEINNLTRFKASEKSVKKIVEVVLKKEKKKIDISIAFIDFSEIKNLNRKYRKKNKATDILSFLYDKSGESVICPEVVKNNSKRFKRNFKKELILVLVHGVLHLLGYDHELSQKKAKEIISGNFTLTDMYEQFQAVKKMGPFGKVLKMIPGLSSSNVPEEMLNTAEGRLEKWGVIIQSMTSEEKENPKLLNSSRAKRIARGSGTTEKDVKELLKQYIMMRKMLKMFKHKKKLPFGLGGGKGMPTGFK